MHGLSTTEAGKYVNQSASPAIEARPSYDAPWLLGTAFSRVEA